MSDEVLLVIGRVFGTSVYFRCVWAGANETTNLCSTLYCSFLPDNSSLLVYRLVHAPVMNQNPCHAWSARKRGSTPRQRAIRG